MPDEFNRLAPELTGGFALTELGELGLHPFQLLGIRLGLIILDGLGPGVFGPLVHRQYDFRSCVEGGSGGSLWAELPGLLGLPGAAGHVVVELPPHPLPWLVWCPSWSP